MDPAHYVLLFLGTHVIGASSFYDAFYYYNLPWFRRADEQSCKVCYGDNDCLTLSEARCDFYSATSEVLYEDEGPVDPGQPELRNQADEHMYNLVEQVSDSVTFKECIPQISQYTDCTKENTCIGCITCSCDTQGLWNCSSAPRCRPEDTMLLDHRDLVYAIENLRSDGKPSFRLKRSVLTETPKKPHRISFEELSAFMYGVNLTTEAMEVDVATTTTATMGPKFDGVTVTIGTLNDESYDLGFDEVLSNTINNSNNSVRVQKVPDKIFANDYMNLEEINVILNEVDKDNATKEGDINKTVTTTEKIDSSSDGYIDLLEIARKHILDKPAKNVTDEKNVIENFTMFDNFNDIEEQNTVNLIKRDIHIMKRDVAQVSITDNEIIAPAVVNTTTEANLNGKLDSGVYQPLNKVIRVKQQELDDLIKIRERLNEILNKNQTEKMSVSFNKSEAIDKDNTTHYAFYNVEIIPEMEYALRKNKVNELDMYLKKLKHDIFTVMKDLAFIQRLSDQAVPEGMKGLIRAMRHYIHRHGKSHMASQPISEDKINDLRRHLIEVQQNGKDFITKHLIAILELVDKNRPQGNALAPLSAKTRTIMRRVLKNYRIDDYSYLGIRVNDPDYNLTNDLKSVGMKWQEMTDKIVVSSPWDRLHNMKMLQLVLESDIIKLTDALALIDFAHSRRMTTLNEDLVSHDELLRINLNLKSIHDNVNEIIKHGSQRKQGSKINKVTFVSKTKESKKETFLKHIKNLLRSSKKDILKLLHKKVPKTEIIKEIAKKKLNEMTKMKLAQYKDVMQKWQNNLNVNNRRKRSPHRLEHIKNRMMNILPKYLRGKVNHKINSTRKTSNSKHKNMKTKKNKKSHKNNNKRNNTKNHNNSRKQHTSKATTSAAPIHHKHPKNSKTET